MSWTCPRPTHHRPVRLDAAELGVCVLGVNRHHNIISSLVPIVSTRHLLLVLSTNRHTNWVSPNTRSNQVLQRIRNFNTFNSSWCIRLILHWPQRFPSFSVFYFSTKAGGCFWVMSFTQTSLETSVPRVPAAIWMSAGGRTCFGIQRCFPVVQPFWSRNALKSIVLMQQQLQYLYLHTNKNKYLLYLDL